MFQNIDLIDTIDGWIGQLTHGRMHRFAFSRYGDFSGAEVEMLLRQYGIRVWARELTDPDEIADDHNPPTVSSVSSKQSHG